MKITRNTIKIILVGVFLSLLNLADADEFYLSDSKGKQLGPFQVTKGEKLILGEKEFTISKVETGYTGPTDSLTPRAKVIAELEHTIIPEINIKKTDFWNAQSRLQILANQKNDFLVKELQRRSFRSQIEGQLSNYPEPVVTLKTKNISVHDTLTSVCEMINFEWVVDDRTILIRADKTKPRVKPEIKDPFTKWLIHQLDVDPEKKKSETNH